MTDAQKMGIIDFVEPECMSAALKAVEFRRAERRNYIREWNRQYIERERTGEKMQIMEFAEAFPKMA